MFLSKEVFAPRYKPERLLALSIQKQKREQNARNERDPDIIQLSTASFSGVVTREKD